MSLIEVMIAMVVFMVLAMGLTSAVVQSQRMSHNNVLQNTAYTVAQGYLEQIRSLLPAEVEAALDDPDGVALPTQGVSALTVGSNPQIDDPIFLDGPDPALTGQTDGSNFREILVDLKEDASGNLREITMESWFDIDIVAIENNSNSYAITIRFEATLAGRGQRMVSGELRGIRADVNQFVSP